MSTMSIFFKANKHTKPNGFYAATKSFTDENGEPVKWELRPLSSEENEGLQNECTSITFPKGNDGKQNRKFHETKYIRKAIAASVVYPDLLNAELQDSYGVTTAEELLVKLVDLASEWNELMRFFQLFNGFKPLADEIEEAKN